MKHFFTSHPVALLSLAVLFSLSQVSFADTISYSTSAVISTSFNPSSDSMSFNAGAGTFDPTGGVFSFQTGDFVVGDSEIPDQDISFTLQDTVTFNGVTQTLNLFGDDNVTRAVDTLTIAAGLPVSFGGELLTLQPFSLSESNLGDDPITLEASVTPTPEPGAVLLLGTGALCAAIFGIKRTQEIPGSATAATASQGDV